MDLQDASEVATSTAIDVGVAVAGGIVAEAATAAEASTSIEATDVVNTSETIEQVFTQTAKDGDLLFYSTEIGGDVIEFCGNFSESNGTLTIKNFDIDGASTNKLGASGVRKIITDFGRQKGVNQVIIQGAKRTTGANPGKTPSQLIFKIWQK